MQNTTVLDSLENDNSLGQQTHPVFGLKDLQSLDLKRVRSVQRSKVNSTLVKPMQGLIQASCNPSFIGKDNPRTVMSCT
jgi:hypothetical protein